MPWLWSSKVSSVFLVDAVVHLKIQILGIVRKRDVYPRRRPETDAMLKGILNKRIQQHRSYKNLTVSILYIHLYLYVVAFVYPHPLYIYKIVEVLYLLAQRYAVLVVFVEHKPHHIAQFLYAVRGLSGVFSQRNRIQRVQGIEQKVWIDLRPQVAQLGRFLADLRLQLRLFFRKHLSQKSQYHSRNNKNHKHRHHPLGMPAKRHLLKRMPTNKQNTIHPKRTHQQCQPKL